MAGCNASSLGSAVRQDDAAGTVATLSKQDLKEVVQTADRKPHIKLTRRKQVSRIHHRWRQCCAPSFVQSCWQSNAPMLPDATDIRLSTFWTAGRLCDGAKCLCLHVRFGACSQGNCVAAHNLTVHA